jgi:hypothetical protein
MYLQSHPFAICRCFWQKSFTIKNAVSSSDTGFIYITLFLSALGAKSTTIHPHVSRFAELNLRAALELFFCIKTNAQAEVKMSILLGLACQQKP